MIKCMKCLDLPTRRPVSIPGASTGFSREKSLVGKTRQEKRQESELTLEDLKASNRRRKRRLLALSEATPEDAKPGLALCRALDALYAGDQQKASDQLAKATSAIGGAP